MRSDYSDKFNARSPHPQTPAAPVITGGDLNATPPFLNVQVPNQDKNGQTLQHLSQLIVSLDDGSLVHEAEAALWKELLPKVTKPVSLADAGQVLNVELPELKPDTDYEFYARADA